MEALGKALNWIKDSLSAALGGAGTGLNFIKDGYLAAINWIVAHPHRTFWSGLAAVALAALVF